MIAPFRLIGTPRQGGALIVADHASRDVPADINLGIDPALLDTHIAQDIGVAAVAERMVAAGDVDAAWLGGVSRLIIDCNREEGHPGLIPAASDGIAIPANAALTEAERAARIARFFTPYHDGLAQLIEAARPALILSLHSFTPSLATQPDAVRPWHIGILYNRDHRAARIAIPWLEGQALCVGDQLPYSGTLLNATMNRHAEARAIPYLGVEVRQDLIGDADGQSQWAARLGALCKHVALQLGQ